MNKTEFMRSEAAASRAFMNKHANEDFSLPEGSVSYSRSYRCDCGFVTDCAETIFSHECVAAVRP